MYSSTVLKHLKRVNWLVLTATPAPPEAETSPTHTFTHTGSNFEVQFPAKIYIYPVCLGKTRTANANIVSVI